MVALAAVKHDRLRTLLGESTKFSNFSEELKAQHVERLNKIPEDKIAPVCEFFELENKREKKKKISALKALYEKVDTLSRSIKKFALKDSETVADQKDEQKLTDLDNQLS